MKKIGFCRQCLRNVPHILYFQWPIFRFLNFFPNFSSSLPISSWHCCGCEKRTYRILRPDSEVPTDVTSTTMDDITPWPNRTDPAQRFGLLFRRKPKTQLLESNQPNAADKERPKFEHVGNVTRSDDSLLVRKSRAARYSKKFREGVVDKILAGKSTITQIRNELGVSERDLLDWINDRVMRQDQKIAKLTQVVGAVKQLTDGSTMRDDEIQLRIHKDGSDVEQPQVDMSQHQGPTIEGRIRHN